MPRYSAPSYVRSILREKEYTIKKKLGQNFLVDQNYVEKIAAAAEIVPSDWVLEIGPGLGVLTAAMAERAHKVVALEIDRELVAILRETLAFPNVAVVETDALTADWRDILEEQGWSAGSVKLVANLPYYITTPLVMKALESDVPFAALVVMVQREVAERMVAPVGSKDYGVLTLAVQYYSQAEIVACPRSVFLPAPEVDSRWCGWFPSRRGGRISSRAVQVIRAAFQQRRKTIRNSSKLWPKPNLPPEAWTRR